jgi:hypothetical protein
MSITRTAVRLAATRAIIGRTLAGDRVADSQIEPIDVAITETRLPIVTVLTDDDSIDGIGRDAWQGKRQLDLVFEIAVATEVKDGAFTIPQTDFGFEWTLDIIEHQIERALFDEGTPWSSIFMALVPTVVSKMSRRGASAERGVRFAARQVVYRVDPIAAPLPGIGLDPTLPYGRLLAAMEGDSELAEYGAFLRNIIEAPMKPEWKRQAEAIGLTRADADAIGIAPYDLTEQGEPALAEVARVNEETGIRLEDTLRGRGAKLTGTSDLDAEGTQE